MKQSSLDDHESMGMDLSGIGSDNADEMELSEFDERRPATGGNENSHMYNNFQNRPQSPVTTPVPVPRGNKFNSQDFLDKSIFLVLTNV